MFTPLIKTQGENWLIARPGTIVIFISIILVIGLLFYIKYKGVPRWAQKLFAAMKVIFTTSTTDAELSYDSLEKVLDSAGYAYDQKQDIFYSKLDPWQRKMGYCRLYDEAAAPLNMIIDCEPIYFSYGGRRWLIQFWKGQYAMNAGCEIGVYSTKGPDLNIPGVFNGTFYNCVGNEDLLSMSLVLKKKGNVLFKREDKHWWLTGFKLGEFSEPQDLTMDMSITLKDEEMTDAFIKGLLKAGYTRREILINSNTVSLNFNETRTPQPLTRIKATDRLIQRKNEILCRKYMELTAGYDTFPDKVNAIKQKAPKLYKSIFKIGKTKKLFDKYNLIKNYLS